MKKAKINPGSFFRIPLSDGTFGYGRVVEEPYVAFYNYRTTRPETDLETIASKSVLFRLAVSTTGLKNWDIIGLEHLEDESAEPAAFFMQDLKDYQKCVIFDTAGSSREATPEECVGIERAAAWESHGVEQRLLDTFMGRPNAAELRARVRLEPSR